MVPLGRIDPTTGRVGVLYNTRGATNGTLFNAELSEGAPGSWTRTTLSQRPSIRETHSSSKRAYQDA